VHEREDELFYVLEGEHVFRVGEQEHRVGPGGVVFGPRGVLHAQRRVVPGKGRLLVLTAPAGLEGFFRHLAAAQEAGTLGLKRSNIDCSTSCRTAGSRWSAYPGPFGLRVARSGQHARGGK
jgi:hypothetical protein